MLEYSDIRFRTRSQFKNMTINGCVLMMTTSGWVNFTIPYRIDTLGPHCFKDTRDTLEHVQISGPYLASMYQKVFKKCKKLVDINLERCINLQSIGTRAFFECESLRQIHIPDSVTAIFPDAFERCYKLKKVIFSENSKLQRMTGNCFGGTKIKEFYFGRYFKMFVSSFFIGCVQLEHVKIHPNNTAYRKINGVIYSSNKVTLRMFPPALPIKHFVIPDFVRVIGPGAFASSTLDVLIVPETITAFFEMSFTNSLIKVIDLSRVSQITRIQTWSFQGIGAHSLDFSRCEKVTEILPEIFKESMSLECISLPPNITVIHIGAFEGCSSLKHIDLWRCSELLYIKEMAFAYTNLEEIHIGPKLEVIEPLSFLSTLNIKKIFIHKDNHNFRVVNNTLFNIENLTSIVYARPFEPLVLTIPSELKSIGPYTYENVKSLYVEFGDELEEISEGAFTCSKLKAVKIPDSVFKLGKRAFSYCENLTTIELGHGITQIPSLCFVGCSILENVIIKGTIINIAQDAFKDCPSLDIVIVNKKCINLLAESNVPFKSLANGVLANATAISSLIPTIEQINERYVKRMNENITLTNDIDNFTASRISNVTGIDKQIPVNELDINIDGPLPRIFDDCY